MAVSTPVAEALSRFYTKDFVSRALVALMRDEPSPYVLDLGSGPGALSHAARIRWEASSIVSVDIDRAAETHLRALPHLRRGGGHRHIVADALSLHLPSTLNKVNFDAAVCNPPYREISWRPEFRVILEESGLGDLAGSAQYTSTEVLFLAQNLRIVAPRGQLGLVVPDSIVSGRKSRALRQTLLGQHRIERVVQLPRGSFSKTDAQAFILVLNKGQSKAKRTLLQRLYSDGSLSGGLAINRAQAEHRLDYEYYAQRNSPSSLQPSLSDLDAQVTRGSVENAIARDSWSSRWVFHTTEFPPDKGSISFPVQRSETFPPGMIWAEPGDILLARVGRSLHKKVCFVERGRAPITDCVLRIRLQRQWQRAVFDALASAKGEARLLSVSRGVAARMISKQELLSMPLELRDGR
ncbi:N-6 DNA methylase [Bradyrhizobium sp. 166]|uniref:N-6 DNA methylase n=1 Tax=Bradyrhizobium sp. 166 TaxID=2782638 RepID=UPI001FFA385C|nr:N-6 DNA methylase [Bradyrhizobium sp. 166]MCK1607254.1 N-6 DNA methylase [Bradyrhizobium sp. 166]